MAAVDLHHQHLQRRWAQEQGAVEERRQQLLVAAGLAAEALRERWPVLQGVWFGAGGQLLSARDLALDLTVEERKLDGLVDSLAALGEVSGDFAATDLPALPA